MRLFFLALAFIAAACVAGAPTDARPSHRGGVASAASSDCPYGSSYDDGCAGANQNALYQNTAFFNAPNTPGSAFQSASQTAVVARPPWNVACVDYKCGQITPDSGLIDPSVTPLAGCLYNSGNLYYECTTNGITVDLTGYKFFGVGIWMKGTGQTLKGYDWHLQMNYDDCRRFNGIGPIRAGSAVVQISNYTADWTEECRNNADQYKETGDPGFADLSSGSATLVGFSLTYQSTPTGKVAVGSYIQVTGQPHMRSRITAGSGLNWTVETPTNGSFSGVTISGTTMSYTGKSGTPAVGDAIVGTGISAGTLLVSDLGGNQWTVSVSQTVASAVSAVVWKQWNYASPVTVTTGPVETNTAALLAGASGQIQSLYGWLPHWGTGWGNTGGGPVDLRYNYLTSVGRGSHPNTTDGNHDQFMAWIPGPGVETLDQTAVQDFNTVMVEPWGDDGTYTGVISQFSTCTSCSPPANSATGYMIQFGHVSMSNNVMVGNESLNAPAKLNISGIFRTLSQLGGFAVGSVNWSLNAGVVTINSIASGSVGVGDTILCNSFPNCSQAVVLTSQIDGTHFTTNNLVDTKSNITNSVAKYPGWFVNLDIKDNYVAPTSASGTVFTDDAAIRVDNKDTSGNIDMLTGGTAN